MSNVTNPPSPVVNLPYGGDVWAQDVIRPGVFVTGGLLLGQATFRRWSTQRRSLLDDLSYGKCISDFLGRAMTPEEIASIPGQLENEALKDERLAAIQIAVQRPNDRSMTVQAAGQGADGTGFSLVMHSDGVTVSLLQLDASNG